MELAQTLLHFEKYLGNVIQFLGPLTYLLLFLIIFAETGFVVAPFLPGDSLLFIAGTFAGGGYLNIWFIYVVFLLAAILGDTVNYWMGNKIGVRVFAKENSRIFKKSYLEKTREFYAKHGGKTIILARFIPIIRTFAPFVAGIGNMNYRTFLTYNIIGGILWVTTLTFAGYFFGGLPLIKDNFEYAVFGVIIVSLLPVLYEYIKHKINRRASKKETTNMQEIRKTFREEHVSD